MRQTGSLLVVDDDAMNRNMLAQRLELKGYDVTEADNGLQALALVEQQPFDLVLLDVMMPEMNGLEVLRVLRRRYAPAELPVIMVTARDQSSDVVEALSSGSNDFVTKPIDLPVVLARIANQLSYKRDQAALRESEARYALAARGTSDGLWHWDRRTDKAFYSSRWKSMLGYEDAEIGDSPGEWFGRVHPDDLERVKSHVADDRQQWTFQFACEHRLAHKDQTHLWVLARGVAIRDQHDKSLRIAGSLTDITFGRVSDPLTGLSNRIHVMDRLERFIERSRRNPAYRFAVLFVDLDRFKVVNDSLGHLIGDQLLIAFARRLEACLRKTDSFSAPTFESTVARLGGDEFTIVVEGISDVTDAIVVAERIRHALLIPFSVSGHEILTSASIGIAMNDPANIVPADLLRDADAAMYDAKGQGKARYIVWKGKPGAATDCDQKRPRGEKSCNYQKML
jgi:diguanylate cyclase (GGDEF)-like protein/PAS domain S-box-containing protein